MPPTEFNPVEARYLRLLKALIPRDLILRSEANTELGDILLAISRYIGLLGADFEKEKNCNLVLLELSKGLLTAFEKYGTTAECEHWSKRVDEASQKVAAMKEYHNSEGT